MVESAAPLVDNVLPHLPMRQWVVSFLFRLRFLFSSRAEIVSRVLGRVYRAVETHLIQQAGRTRVPLRPTRDVSSSAFAYNFARPAVATDRLALTPQGNARYTRKTPYRDGTTHMLRGPLDTIARLAVWVPKPRMNLARFHGVFAPNSPLRQQVRQPVRANGPRFRRYHRYRRPKR